MKKNFLKVILIFFSNIAFIVISFSSATTLNLYATWEHLFGADNVYYGVNGEWKLVETYYGVDGQWVPLKIYYGNDNKWKNNT